VAPPLTRILRSHLDEFGAGPDDRVFSGIQRGELASITYCRAWDKARGTALTPAEYASQLARRAYMTCAMRASPPGSTAASRPPRSPSGAGHSVAVLLKVYAKCIDGQDQMAKRRIENALRGGVGHATAEDSGGDAPG
jgi:hypothetical protein